jgi:TonB family protein
MIALLRPASFRWAAVLLPLVVCGHVSASLSSRLPFGGSWSDAPAYKITTIQGVEFVRAPMPKYPAGTGHLVGRSVVQLKLDRRTGSVLSVELVQSTGYEALDRAALFALKHRRAKPGVGTNVVNIPVRFPGHSAQS